MNGGVHELIKQLSNDSVDFYVHVDKKSGQFTLPSLPNVFVVEDNNRVDVSWGRCSMVKATLALIDMMISKGKYDYACLISGQCFPIKSNQEIISYLESNNGLNYIDVMIHSGCNYNKMLKRSELYYPELLYRRTLFAKVLK